MGMSSNTTRWGMDFFRSLRESLEGRAIWEVSNYVGQETEINLPAQQRGSKQEKQMLASKGLRVTRLRSVFECMRFEKSTRHTSQTEAWCTI